MQVPTPEINVHIIPPLFSLFILPAMLIIAGGIVYGFIRYRRMTKESTRIWD